MSETPWTETSFVALDLEGTGAQDREDEEILEVATVPLAGGLPDMQDAYETLVRPSRPVPRRPWISPGLTDAALRDAPPPASVGPELARRLDGRYLLGHNVGVDWRLLHRHYPGIEIRGLVDTLKLAKRGKTKTRSLAALIDHYALTNHVAELVPDGRPHRALWDTVAAAVLLPALVEEHWPQPPSLAELLAVAAHQGTEQHGRGTDEQQTLL
ncbi:DNA polymerase-3 subunit epsilon [Haloactinospora alba]|uniref:DNA polymerase-3 subunit epsilon n=1 Tax=Haloactinospora alba TaxID=405555 RepID=A0A543NH52_9ACTN|nr:3'-5' exonuclease [Haloactinospora alba]TQN31162.1 DNA polymerase-3 subunit epsilon [Haloactinospora alba]